MTLIWHIFKKDLWHTRIFAGVWLAALMLSTWVDARILSGAPESRGPFLNVQPPADYLVLVALGLFGGLLFLAERIPGVRAYWLARPVRWQDLLAAKALVLAVVAVLPVVALHWAVVAWRGFPLADFAGALTWNGIWLVAVCVVPVAALASISRNLQELVLWALAAGGAIFGLLITGANRFFWSAPALVVWLVLAGCAGLLCWQYWTRRTGAGRIAVAAICLGAGTVGYWPDSLWDEILNRGFPVRLPESAGRLAPRGDVPVGWLGSRFIPAGNRGILASSFDLVGLPAGWSGELLHIRLGRLWAGGGEDTGEGVIKGSLNTLNQEGEWHLSAPFLDRNDGKPVNLDVIAGILISGPVQRYTIPVNSRQYLPEIGWCGVQEGGQLRLECQSVLTRRIRLVGSWGNFPLIHDRADLDPAGSIPSLHPLRQMTGVFASSESFASKPVVLEYNKPMAYIRREQQLRNVLLRTREQP